MSPAAPFQEDRPLRRDAVDLLGFEQIAEGLAVQLHATVASGLLVAVRAAVDGGGRTSFLNLLHAALLERRVLVLRLAGSADLAEHLRQCRSPSGLPPPIVLVDDAEPAAFADLSPGTGDAGIVAAWRCTADADEIARGRTLAPLEVALPEWTSAAAARLAEASGAEDDTPTWTRLLATAASPREALRLARAGTAAAACSRAPRHEVLAALSALRGLGAPEGEPGNVPPELLEHVRRFLGAVPAPSPGEPARPVAALPQERSRPSEAPASAPWLFGSEVPEPGDLVVPKAVTGFGGVATPRAVLEPTPEVAAIEAAGEHEAAESLPLPTDAALPDEGVVDDAEGRRRRCTMLGRRGGPAARDELLRALRDPHPAVRLSASQALGALGDPTAAPELRRLLGSPDASLRRTAAFVLGRLEDAAARDDLVRLLVDVSPGVRRAAVAALGRLGGADVIRPLLLALEDGHAGARMAAETALSRSLGDLPESALDQHLQDPDPHCRIAALRIAGRLGFGSRVAIECLLGERGPVAVEAAEALGRRREEASLPALAAAAGGTRGDLRSASLAAIGRIAEAPPAEGLARLLGHEDGTVRDVAKAALARCPGAVEAVLPFLAEGSEELRESAADALGRTGDRRAVGPLLDLHDTAEPTLRRAAAASLVRLGFDV